VGAQTVEAMDSLLRPKSVAVVGASNDLTKFGGKVALNISRSNIPIRYYINAGGSAVLGEKSFRSLRELPEAPEAVVLAVPADVALAELAHAGAMGARAGVVFAAGFREAGEEGMRREQALANIAAQYRMAVLGPNCVGLANYADGAYLSSADGLEDALAGSISLIAQSGSLGIAVGSRHKRRFRQFISTGRLSPMSPRSRQAKASALSC
jgi:acyl-CoA synthetase (NDP forming)